MASASLRTASIPGASATDASISDASAEASSAARSAKTASRGAAPRVPGVALAVEVHQLAQVVDGSGRLLLIPIFEGVAPTEGVLQSTLDAAGKLAAESQARMLLVVPSCPRS